MTNGDLMKLTIVWFLNLSMKKTAIGSYLGGQNDKD